VLDASFVIMSFVRGEQIVELAAHDPTKSEIHFYVLKFRQGCNKFGCTAGDLFTPAVERDWTSWALYEDVDLRNTALDCTHCHQPGGPTARKILRLQERKAPWTHWLRNNLNEPGGVALVQDFTAAHDADEDYAGVPVSLVTTPRNDPLLFEALVENNSLNPQPNEFPGGLIEIQVKASAPGQPEINVPRGTSATWNALFANAVTGAFIPVPYHDVKVTDPGKLASLTSAYRSVMDGLTPRAALPDLRDIFLEEGLPEMGFRPKAGATGAELLSQMCKHCHDDNADPTLSKSKFNLDQLATMSMAEKTEAIARMNEPRGSVKLMPPVFVGELSAAEIALAAAALQ
jgi:hypothetical protein